MTMKNSKTQKNCELSDLEKSIDKNVDTIWEKLNNCKNCKLNVIYGLNGSGKTILLNKINEKLTGLNQANILFLPAEYEKDSETKKSTSSTYKEISSSFWQKINNFLKKLIDTAEKKLDEDKKILNLSEEDFKKLEKSLEEDSEHSNLENENINNLKKNLINKLLENTRIYYHTNLQKQEISSECLSYTKDIYFKKEIWNVFNAEFLIETKLKELESLSNISNNWSSGESFYTFLKFLTTLFDYLNVNKNMKNYIIIDEPEKFSHPTLQLLIIHTILQLFSNKKIGFFIVTHSPIVLSEVIKFKILEIWNQWNSCKNKNELKDPNKREINTHIWNISKAENNIQELKEVLEIKVSGKVSKELNQDIPPRYINNLSRAILSDKIVLVEGIQDSAFVYSELYKKETDYSNKNSKASLIDVVDCNGVTEVEKFYELVVNKFNYNPKNIFVLFDFDSNHANKPFKLFSEELDFDKEFRDYLSYFDNNEEENNSKNIVQQRINLIKFLKQHNSPFFYWTTNINLVFEIKDNDKSTVKEFFDDSYIENIKESKNKKEIENFKIEFNKFIEN